MLRYSPKLVTDGLITCLDASQNTSLPTYDLPVKAGLTFWLDASDDTTFSYSSGTVVSQWRDKSGNDFHTSQGTVANQPSRSTTQNSRKTVNFDGTNDFLSVSNFICNSEMSIFVVSNCGNTLFIEHSADANTNDGFYIYGGGGGMFKIKRSAQTSLITYTNWLSGAYSVASGVNSTGLDLLTYKDGTQQTITTDSRASITNSYTTTTLYIGSRAGTSVWTNGPIAEIIIYNRKVTDKERKLIHTYLGLKWGISNTDRSFIDLSENANDGLLGNGTVANMPLVDFYNKNAFKFDGADDYIKIGTNSSLRPNTVSIGAFFKTINNSQSTQFIAGYGDTGSNGYWIGMTGGPIVFSSGNGTTGLQLSSSTTPNNDQIYYVVGTYDGTSQKIYVDAVLKNTGTTVTGNLSYSGLTDGFLLGQVQSFSSLRYLTGSIYNLHVYNRALTAVEISQNYEALKARFSVNIVQKGLILSLDSGNPYSYAGSGTTWYDVSGNANNATLINSPTYSTDNGGVLNWVAASSQYATVPMYSALRMANITQEAWVYLNSTAAQVFIGMQYGSSSNNSYALWVDSGVFNFGVNTGGTFYYNGSSAPTTGVWYHLAHTYNGTIQYFYINGVQINAFLSSASGNIAYDISNTKLAIAADFNTGYDGGPVVFVNGKMPIVRLYNRALTAAEVLQNYNAMKGRFGL